MDTILGLVLDFSMKFFKICFLYSSHVVWILKSDSSMTRGTTSHKSLFGSSTERITSCKVTNVSRGSLLKQSLFNTMNPVQLIEAVTVSLQIT